MTKMITFILHEWSEQSKYSKGIKKGIKHFASLNVDGRVCLSVLKRKLSNF